MSVFKTLLLAVVVSTLVAACSYSERKAHKSQTKVNKSQVVVVK